MCSSDLFGVAELMARIRAHLRRRQPETAQHESLFCIGEIQIDFSLRTIMRKGEAVHLSPIEYRLLSTLCRHPGKVLTHQQLLKEVWGPGNLENGHYLRIYMANLRQKLEDEPAQPVHFITETGVGYRLVL